MHPPVKDRDHERREVGRSGSDAVHGIDEPPVNNEHHHQGWNDDRKDPAANRRLEFVDVRQAVIQSNDRGNQAHRGEEQDLAVEADNEPIRSDPREDFPSSGGWRACQEIEDRSEQEQQSTDDERCAPELVKSLRFLRHVAASTEDCMNAGED